MILADKVTSARPHSMLYRLAQAQIDLAYFEVDQRMKEETSFAIWNWLADEWWSLSLISISMRTRLF